MEDLPKFLTEFEPLKDVVEEQDINFECHISPDNDDTMTAQWYHDDKPLTFGSRFDPYLEDGKVGLCISPIYEPDSGTYRCRLTNKNGTAEQSVTLSCIDTNSHIHSAPLLSKKSMKEIKLLENPKSTAPTRDAKVDWSDGSILTIRPLKSKIVSKENAAAILDLEVAVVNGDGLKNSELIVEWLHDKRPLLSSNRYKRGFEFGIISLKIDPVSYHDRGRYQVDIYGKGSDQKILLLSQECELEVRADVHNNTKPICYNSYEQIKKLEAWERPSTRYAALHPDRPLPSGLAIRELMKRRAASKINN